MSISQLLRIILARKWLVLGALLICAITGAVVSLFILPKQYAADASMVFEIRPDPVLGALAPGLSAPAYLATQIEIIRSDRVAMRAVDILGIDKSPTAAKQWRDSTHAKVSIQRYFATLLQKAMMVEPSRGSNLITLTFVSADPAFAAAAANAFVQAYMETSVELRTAPAKQSAEWLDGQTRTLRSDLEQAQARLSKFQQDRGIVATDDRMDQEALRLNVLNSQLAAAQIEHVEASSRQRNTGSDASPDVQQSAAIQSIKSQLALAETKLSEIKIIVGVNHPQRVQLEAQIAELKQQLARETSRVSSGASLVSRGTSQKVEELRALVEAQKRRLLALNSERDQIAVLQRDVEAARRAFDSVSQRAGQLNLESRNTQADVRLLTAAVEPMDPSRPNIPKNIAASVLLGLVLGLGLAVGLELLDRRVRGPEDLMVAAGVPLLGVLRPADSKRPIYRQLLPARATLPQLPPVQKASS